MISFFFFSCTTYKPNRVIENFINDDIKDSVYHLRYQHFPKSIFKIKYLEQNIITSEAISEYLPWKEENIPEYVFHSAWIDQSEKFVLSESEIKAIRHDLKSKANRR